MGSVTKIEKGSKNIDDFTRIQNQLEDAYRSFMLEETAPNSALITRCFINGGYYYNKAGFSVRGVRNFLRLFKSSTQEKRMIFEKSVKSLIKLRNPGSLGQVRDNRHCL